MRDGVVDRVLYVSELQKQVLSPGYASLPGKITGNYIDPTFFPFRNNRNEVFTIGRLSRADIAKYPEDFPVFYESLALPEVRFRVMAWDEKLRRKYRWHSFDNRWDLLSAEQEPAAAFLRSLDLFVYPLGHNFTESWGRSTVEAMLSGAVPLVPVGHNLDLLVVHGATGYICGDFLEYQEHAQRLFSDYELRLRISKQCRQHAVEKLCNRDEHLRLWMEALR